MTAARAIMERDDETSQGMREASDSSRESYDDDDDHDDDVDDHDDHNDDSTTTPSPATANNDRTVVRSLLRLPTQFELTQLCLNHLREVRRLPPTISSSMIHNCPSRTALDTSTSASTTEYLTIAVWALQRALTADTATSTIPTMSEMERELQHQQHPAVVSSSAAASRMMPPVPPSPFFSSDASTSSSSSISSSSSASSCNTAEERDKFEDHARHCVDVAASKKIHHCEVAAEEEEEEPWSLGELVCAGRAGLLLAVPIQRKRSTRTSDFLRVPSANPPTRIRNTTTHPHPHPNPPLLLNDFVKAVHEKGFFQGTVPGSADYHTKMAKVVATFQTKMAELQLQQEQEDDDVATGSNHSANVARRAALAYRKARMEEERMMRSGNAQKAATHTEEAKTLQHSKIATPTADTAQLESSCGPSPSGYPPPTVQQPLPSSLTLHNHPSVLVPLPNPLPKPPPPPPISTLDRIPPKMLAASPLSPSSGAAAAAISSSSYALSPSSQSSYISATTTTTMTNHNQYRKTRAVVTPSASAGVKMNTASARSPNHHHHHYNNHHNHTVDPHAEAYKNQGNAAMQQKNFVLAEHWYTRALQVSSTGPHSHIYYANRAAAYVSVQQYDRALADAQQSLALQPTYGKAYARLGVAHFLLGDYDAAVHAYTRSLHYEPHNVTAQHYLDKALRRQRQQLPPLLAVEEPPQPLPQQQEEKNNEKDPSSAAVLPSPLSMRSVLPPHAHAHAHAIQPILIDSNLTIEVKLATPRTTTQSPSPSAASSPSSARKTTSSPYVVYEKEEEDLHSPGRRSSTAVVVTADQYKARGNQCMARRDFAGAYQAYSQAIAMVQLQPLSSSSSSQTTTTTTQTPPPTLTPNTPNTHVYYSNRAAALCYLERYSDAQSDALTSVRLAPHYGKGHARLGLCKFFLSDYAGAVQSYQEALLYDPENAASQAYLLKAQNKLAQQVLGQQQQEPQPSSSSSL